MFLHCYIKQCLHASKCRNGSDILRGYAGVVQRLALHSHASCQFLLRSNSIEPGTPVLPDAATPPVPLLFDCLPGEYHSPNTSGACIQRHQVVLYSEGVKSRAIRLSSAYAFCLSSIRSPSFPVIRSCKFNYVNRRCCILIGNQCVDITAFHCTAIASALFSPPATPTRTGMVSARLKVSQSVRYVF